MSKIYLIVWAGGYEAPSYALKPTREEAIEQGESWFEDVNPEDGDYVDVLEIDTDTFTIERVKV